MRNWIRQFGLRLTIAVALVACLSALAPAHALADATSAPGTVDKLDHLLEALAALIPTEGTSADLMIAGVIDFALRLYPSARAWGLVHTACGLVLDLATVTQILADACQRAREVRSLAVIGAGLGKVAGVIRGIGNCLGKAAAFMDRRLPQRLKAEPAPAPAPAEAQA